MDRFKRFAVYAVPDGPLGEAGSRWLGWDCVAGEAVAQPDLPELPEPASTLTETPRRYGFHGTIKPPFHLVPGRSVDDLRAAFTKFCADAAPVSVPAIEVRRLGGFVAIVPIAPSDPLADLAAATMRALDPFRAPLTEVELARRRASGLSARQEELLRMWGYPFVMDEFRFHLTLTGRLGRAKAERAASALAAHFAPVLPAPFRLDSLCLMGEDTLGRFHLIHRAALGA